MFYVAKTGPADVALLVKHALTDKDREASGASGQHQYEPFDNATWALIRIDALSTNPNWQRIPGLLDAQRRILERMLQFYLPDFSRSGSYLDMQHWGDADEEKTKSEERQSSLDEEKKKDEESFKKELTKDFQFYYGLLMAFPDLLPTDKYRIIEKEQLRFQRHLHVLATADLRDRLVSEAYARWREDVRKKKCGAIKDRFGDTVENRNGVDPCANADQSTEDTTAPKKGDRRAPIEEEGQGELEELDEVSMETMSPERAAWR